MTTDEIAQDCCLVKVNDVLILLATTRDKAQCSMPEWWDKADIVIEVIHIEGVVRMCRVTQERTEYRE